MVNCRIQGLRKRRKRKREGIKWDKEQSNRMHWEMDIKVLILFSKIKYQEKHENLNTKLYSDIEITTFLETKRTFAGLLTYLTDTNFTDDDFQPSGMLANILSFSS